MRLVAVEQQAQAEMVIPVIMGAAMGAVEVVAPLVAQPQEQAETVARQVVEQAAVAVLILGQAAHQAQAEMGLSEFILGR